MKKVRVRVSMLLDVELPEDVEIKDLVTPDVVEIGAQVDATIIQDYVVGSDRIEEVEPDARW